MKLSISRYNPERDKTPYLQGYEIELVASDHMLLDVLLRLKRQDDTLAFRRSCREGVCGSDAMNINGRNGLACITRTPSASTPLRCPSQAPGSRGHTRPRQVPVRRDETQP